MRINKYILILLLVFGGSPLLNAQPGKSPVETIAGVKYHMHTVKKGETVYGISKMYKVTADEILKANPDADKGLKLGEVLKIPFKSDGKVETIKVTPPIELVELPQHTVEKGETLYGIAKKYNLTVERLIELNPNAKNGISIGDKLNLEAGTKIAEKTNINNTNKNIETNPPVDHPNQNPGLVLVEHVIKKGETLFSISQIYTCSQDSVKLYNKGMADALKIGQVLIIPVSKSLAETKGWRWYPDLRTISEVKEKEKLLRKDVYNVGLFLPFYLDKNQNIWENQSSNSTVELYEPTRQSLDFYHGVLLALDSLKQYGLSVKLHVFDTYQDSARLNKLVNDPEFNELDLIIGPTDKVEVVAAAAKQKQIPMVCPFGYTNKILFDNPYVVKAISSSSLLISATSTYIVKNYSKENIILIDGKGKKDEVSVASFKKILNTDLAAAGIKDTVKYVKAEAYASKAWIDKLSKDRINVLVLPSNDYGYVSSFFNTLSGTSLKYNYKEYRFVVIGTDDWLKYEEIDLPTKVKFGVTIPSPVMVDFNDSLKTLPFIKSFRAKFHSDPDKYAMMGFDISYFFLSGYLTEGKEFINLLQNYEVDGIHTTFKFRKVNENSGYLNTNVYILKYQDFKLTKIE